MEGYTPSYQFYYKGDDQIVANIWNADKDWKIEVYENGTKTGEMKPYESNATKRDAWASGYHCGVQGRARPLRPHQHEPPVLLHAPIVHGFGRSPRHG